MTRCTDYTAVCIEFHLHSANIKRHDTHPKLFAFICREAERALLCLFVLCVFHCIISD